MEPFKGEWMPSLGFSETKNVQSDKIKASYKDGVLNITLPRSGEAKKNTRPRDLIETYGPASKTSYLHEKSVTGTL